MEEVSQWKMEEWSGMLKASSFDLKMLITKVKIVYETQARCVQKH